MITKTLRNASLGLGMLIIFQGCMAIKSTEGVKAYLNDTAKAEIAAVKSKDKFPKKESTEYKEAERLFDTAAATSNGWLKGLAFDAKVKKTFNVTVAAYKNSEAFKAIDAFLDESSLLLGKSYAVRSLDPVSALAIVDFVGVVIQKICEMHNKQAEKAIEVITKQLDKSGWTIYSRISQEYIDKKYSDHP